MNNYEEIKTEILNKAKVYDVVSSYGIDVTKKGDNYWCVCPFHDDHTPSMSMPSDGKIYTCFVCHAHGNVFNFVMDYENVSFSESMSILSKKLGLSYNFKSTKKIKVSDDTKYQYDIYDLATKFYINKLKSSEGVKAIEYLHNRGITDEIISEFKIGLSSKNSLYKLLKDKGYTIEEITKTTLCNNGENGLYDMFTNRIMFPLTDLDGNVVAFSGRIYKDSDKGESKYVNSKASDIFIKGDILYNYKRAKEYARSTNTIIVVEGFMDVIALYKVGIYNVVAGMGTAITKNQANLIKKMAKNVILMFDGDTAGEKATNACIEELNAINVEAKVVRLPDNLDPDEYIDRFGKEKILNYIDNPKNLLDYMLDSYKKGVDLSNSESVSNYIKNVAKVLSNIDDKIVRELEIQKLSNETNVSVSTINNLITKKDIKIKPVVKEKKKLNKYDKAEQSLIYYMIRDNSVIKLYRNNKCYVPTQNYRYLISEIVHYYNVHDDFDRASFLAYLGDEKDLVSTFNEIDTLALPTGYTYDEILDYMNLLNKKLVDNEIEKLMNKFKMETDEEKRILLVEEINKLRSE